MVLLSIWAVPAKADSTKLVPVRAAYQSGDLKLAAHLAFLLANDGDADAEAMLGAMYSEGAGVPKDSTKALDWLQRSAKQNNAIAQYTLGYIYHNANGVAKDDREAARWWKLASDQQYGDAEERLAWLYSIGSGVPKNIHKANELWAKAAKHGTMRKGSDDPWYDMPRAELDKFSAFKGHPFLFSLIAGPSLLLLGQVWLLIFCVMGANLLARYIVPLGGALLQVTISSMFKPKVEGGANEFNNIETSAIVPIQFLTPVVQSVLTSLVLGLTIYLLLPITLGLGQYGLPPLDAIIAIQILWLSITASISVFFLLYLVKLIPIVGILASIPGIDTFLVATRIYVELSSQLFKLCGLNIPDNHLIYPGFWVTVAYGAIACVVALLIIFVPIWIAASLATFLERSKWQGENLMFSTLLIHKIFSFTVMPSLGVLAGIVPTLMFTQYVYFAIFTAKAGGF